VAAVVGFDAHGGFSHAVMDGWVMCAEHKEAALAAYEEQEVESAKKMIEKNQERILNNWKKLINKMLITERLKIKYNNKITTNVHQLLDDEHDEKVKASTVNFPKTSKAANKKIVSSDDDDDKQAKQIAETKPKATKKAASKPEPKAKEASALPKVTRPSRAKPKRNTTKHDEYDDDDAEEEEEEYKADEYEEQSESDYEAQPKPKSSSKTTKKNPLPPKKAAVTRGPKKLLETQEPVNTVRKQPVNTKTNHGDDDLNLSNDEE